MKLKVNLAPQGKYDVAALQRLSKVLPAIFGLWLVANLVFMLAITREHREVTEMLAAATSTSAVQPSPAATPAAADEVRKADAILQRRAFRWSQMLYHLEQSWHEGIQVRSIEPDFAHRTLAVQMLAVDDAVFRDYLGKLLQYEAFSEVLLLRQEHTEVSNAAGKSVTALRCELSLRGGLLR